MELESGEGVKWSGARGGGALVLRGGEPVVGQHLAAVLGLGPRGGDRLQLLQGATPDPLGHAPTGRLGDVMAYAHGHRDPESSRRLGRFVCALNLHGRTR